jgi:hypothetical protein
MAQLFTSDKPAAQQSIAPNWWDACDNRRTTAVLFQLSYRALAFSVQQSASLPLNKKCACYGTRKN